LLDFKIFEFLIFLISADTAAEWESATFLVIQSRGSRWVRNSQWAVDTVAVLGRGRIRIHSVDGVMAGPTEVIGTPTAVRCDGAAVHALPISEINTVLLTFSHSDTHLLKQALLAQKILFGSLALLISLHLLLAVDKSTEVGLLAVVALIERATMHGKLLRFVVVMILLICQSLVTEDSLSFSIFQSCILDSPLHMKKWAYLSCDRL